MLLQVVDLFRFKRIGGDAFIDVAVEHKYGLFGIFRGKRRVPYGIAFGIEQGDFVGNMHQLGDLLRGKLTQLLHQDFCFGQKVGLGKAADGGGVFFVEVFGWG